MATLATGESQRLQVRCFALENFRTFRERMAIEFEPEVTVFHGETGSGKSTALVAMDVFFRTLYFLLTQGPGQKPRLAWNQNVSSFNRAEPLMAERDRPLVSAPTVLGATFVHNPSLWVLLRFEAIGPDLQVSMEWNLDGIQSSRQDLLQRLFVFGATTRPLAVLDARRRPRWVSGQASAPLLAPSLSKELYALRTSKVAADRERWRSFTTILSDFPTLRGATISIEAGDPPELVIEHPGRIVLGIDELSSGEQELTSLTAALLLARAPIVAIEEPEMGLDVKTQELWRTVCRKQWASGFVHQIVFESHQPTFDGPRVVRFSRGPDGYTVVDPPRPKVVESEVAKAAMERGAKEVFVTPEGYTQLPESMRSELALGEKGAHVWFLPGPDTWEAWPEQKLEALLKVRTK
jgi:AAA domain-containing protein